jgi:hypothetical protein
LGLNEPIQFGRVQVAELRHRIRSDKHRIVLELIPLLLNLFLRQTIFLLDAGSPPDAPGVEVLRKEPVISGLIDLRGQSNNRLDIPHRLTIKGQPINITDDRAHIRPMGLFINHFQARRLVRGYEVTVGFFVIPA